MPYKDPERKREANRRWAAANPEKQRAAVRRWGETHPERVREMRRNSARRVRAADPEGARRADERRRSEADRRQETAKRRERKERQRAADPERARRLSTEANRRWRANNPDEYRANKRQWRAINGAREQEMKRLRRRDPQQQQRSADLKRRATYGITRGEFLEMLELQDGRCAICRCVLDATDLVSKPIVIDHNHDHCPKGRGCPECIRGLLCNKCNRGLGHFDDDPRLLRAAADYLERYPRWEGRRAAELRRVPVESGPDPQLALFMEGTQP